MLGRKSREHLASMASGGACLPENGSATFNQVGDFKGGLTTVGGPREGTCAESSAGGGASRGVSPESGSLEIGTASRERLRELLVLRIGEDRHSLWFREPVRLGMEGSVLAVHVGNRFGRDFLKRTFGEELMAVARSIGGADAGVVFRIDDGSQPDGDFNDKVTSPRQSGNGARRPRGKEDAPDRQERPDDSWDDGKTPQQQGPVEVAMIDRTVPKARGDGTADSVERDGPRSVLARSIRGRQSGRFSDFLVGTSNRMAVAAAELVIRNPGETSPLVIVGPSGVGKTHLLEATCSAVRERSPGLTSVYLSSEQFTTSFLQALHGGGLPGFRRNCRSADVLAIDDIQFFVGKRATIVELQQTLDALQRQGKQVIVSSDRDISMISDFGGDLSARLSGGMVAKIGTPDVEVRRKYVESLACRKSLGLSDAVIDYIVTHISRSTRELAGAVNRLEATSHMLGVSITIDLAVDSLSDLVRSSVRSVRLADIEKAICSAFGLEPGALQSSRRAKTVNHPRMLAMFLARRHTPAALTEIGSFFGRRSHSTVIAAQKAVAAWVVNNATVQIADAVWGADEAIRRVEDMLRAS